MEMCICRFDAVREVCHFFGVAVLGADCTRHSATTLAARRRQSQRHEDMFLAFVRFYKYGVILIVTVHWVIMFLWLRHQTKQFYESRCQQLFFNVAMTTTHLFCYVDLTDDYDKNNYCFCMVF